MNILALMLLLFPAWHRASHDDPQHALQLIQALQQATAADDYQTADSQQGELIRSRPVALLVAVWDTTQDRELLYILFHIPNDSVVIRFFQRLALDAISHESYLANMYLAAMNDTISLARLVSAFWEWPESSWEKSYTARLFGELHYRPAIPTLIDALDAASLNLSDEVYQSLKCFYPNTPALGTPAEAKKYFLKRYRRGR